MCNLVGRSKTGFHTLLLWLSPRHSAMLGVQVCTNLPWGGQRLAIVKTNSQGRKDITLAAREGPEFLYNA